MQPHILFVDDEPFWAKPYIQELRKQFVVDAVETAEDAIAAFTGTTRYDAMVLDVIMPSPSGEEHATNDGDDTGLWVLGKLRDSILAKDTCVLVVTHRNFQHVTESVKQLKFPPGLVEARPKSETPLFRIRGIIQQMLDAHRNVKPATPATTPKPGTGSQLVRENNTWVETNSSETAVIFVHGILSSSETCWRNTQAKTFWPELVVQDPQFMRPSIFLSGYTADLAAGEFDSYDAAEETIARLRSNVDGNGAPLEKPNLLFVCHSQGGIVVRRMLCSHLDAFARKKVGVVLCGSPSWGSRWGSLLKPLAHIIGFRQAVALGWEDTNLQNLDRDFLNLMGRKAIPELCGMNLIETKGFFGLPKLVTTASATRYFNKWYKIPKANHSQVVKPNNMNHLSHVYLRDFAKSSGFIPPATGLRPKVLPTF